MEPKGGGLNRNSKEAVQAVCWFITYPATFWTNPKSFVETAGRFVKYLVATFVGAVLPRFKFQQVVEPLTFGTL